MTLHRRAKPVDPSGRVGAVRLTIDAAGRILLTPPVLEQLGVRPGDDIDGVVCGDGLHLSPTQPSDLADDRSQGPRSANSIETNIFDLVDRRKRPPAPASAPVDDGPGWNPAEDWNDWAEWIPAD